METIGLQEKARPLQGTIEARTVSCQGQLLYLDRVASAGTVEFAREGVAIDERFTFQATAVYRGAA